MPRMRRCRATECHAMCAIPHWYCPKHIDQEAAYLANRERWARGHDADYQHKYNTVTRNRNTAKSEQYKFYQSKQWKELRRLVLDRDSHLDQYAKAVGIIRPGNTVDHCIPYEVAPEIHDHADNLVTCSPETHKLKTKWEQEYYGTGIGNKHTNATPISDIGTIAKLIWSEQND